MKKNWLNVLKTTLWILSTLFWIHCSSDPSATINSVTGTDLTDSSSELVESTDTGGDSGADSDADSDADGDSDSDSDADSDTDSETGFACIDKDSDSFCHPIDCNDGDGAISPGASEIGGNDIDENCDGVKLTLDTDIPSDTDFVVDSEPDTRAICVDNDSDDYCVPFDCNDANDLISPDAADIPGNSVDENCDGADSPVDLDSDGWYPPLDCDNNDPSINPGALEIGDNGIDEDCDGVDGPLVDADLDGFFPPEDCNDADFDINPDAADIGGNGIDEDCDGTDAPADVTGLDPEQFCAGTGAIAIPGQQLCTGDLAKRVFGFALCSCTNFSTNNTLITDSTNTDETGQTSGLFGGSVGVNGNFGMGYWGVSTVGGGLYVGGNTQPGQTTIRQDYWSAGTTDARTAITVDGDAHTAGLVSSSNNGGWLTVNGDYYSDTAPNLQRVSVPLARWIDGPVVAPSPCDCADPIDIQAVVDAFQGVNDNFYKTNNVTYDTFTKSCTFYPSAVTLSCGRYYFTGFNDGCTPLTITLTGRTVMAIEGNFTNNAAVTFVLEPGAELDLFITGNVLFNSPVTIGRADSAKSVRIYVGGTNDVHISAATALYGNLYMPNARLFQNYGLNMSGAVFAKEIFIQAQTTVHYDENVLTLDGCQPKTKTCSSCRSCVNPLPACGADGKCRACTADSECCPPLYCDTRDTSANKGLCMPRPPKVE